jgi:hypothetical protein
MDVEVPASPHPKRGTIDTLWDRRTRGKTELTAFLERHRRMTTERGGQFLPQNNDWHPWRRVCYDADRERGLYMHSDGYGSWYRTQFGPCLRVQYEVQHRPMCDGRPLPKDMPHSFLGRLLAGCGCPTVLITRNSFWRTDPPGMEVDFHGSTVKHGDAISENRLLE